MVVDSMWWRAIIVCTWWKEESIFVSGILRCPTPAISCVSVSSLHDSDLPPSPPPRLPRGLSHTHLSLHSHRILGHCSPASTSGICFESSPPPTHYPIHPPITTSTTVMSSQPPALVKSASNPKQAANTSSPGPAVSQTQAFFSNSAATRSGNASTRNAPAPRNIQAAKPKHKSKNKATFRLVDEDAEAEEFSMQNPHGRRGQQSITHLMQFALPPRPQYQQHHFRHGGGRRGERTGRTWGLGSGYHAVDKAR